MSIFKYGVTALMFGLLSACALFERPDRFDAEPITFDQLQGWENDSHLEALLAFRQSCPILAKSPKPTTATSQIVIPQAIWLQLCSAANQTLSPKVFFETHFTPYRIANNGREQGLFTGYYEPLLYGSLLKQGDYIYPIYAVPSGRKNYTRREIDQGALVQKGLEIAWVDDPVMLFFMQIQGSGRIRLNDGSEFIAAYAGQNGQQYVSIGKVMIEEELMQKEDINFFTLRQWLYDHPDQAFAMMQNNPSYVFFKRQNNLEVKGAIAAPLTAKRSLAIDKNYIPYGLPLYLETSLPDTPSMESQPFNRLMIAQDTGGAIKKPVRGDVFFGHGPEAEYLAGFMKQQGSYSLLVPKGMPVFSQPDTQ